ncbi:zinc finger domain-containing protein [Aeromonas veronii]
MTRFPAIRIAGRSSIICPRCATRKGSR